jgi:hypothetical protein
MKRRTEDELIQLAFGELGEQEAAEIESRSQGDQEAAKTLATYRAMRESLREMNSIPESQLSKERLREALLRDGLKKESAGWGWSWAFVPLAAAVIAFAFTTFRSPGGGMADQGLPLVIEQSPGDRVVIHTEPLSFGGIKEYERTFDFGSNETATFSTDEEPAAPEAAPRRPSGEPRQRASQSQPRAAAAGSGNEPPVEPSVTIPGRPTMRASDQSGMFETAPSAPAEPSIVLIGSERDRDTGAQKAMELESSTNVLIGG